MIMWKLIIKRAWNICSNSLGACWGSKLSEKKTYFMKWKGKSVDNRIGKENGCKRGCEMKGWMDAFPI